MVILLALHAKKDATGHARTCHDVPGSDFSFVGSTFPGATRSGQERGIWDYGYFVPVLGLHSLSIFTRNTNEGNTVDLAS